MTRAEEVATEISNKWRNSAEISVFAVAKGILGAQPEFNGRELTIEDVGNAILKAAGNYCIDHEIVRDELNKIRRPSFDGSPMQGQLDAAKDMINQLTKERDDLKAHILRMEIIHKASGVDAVIKERDELLEAAKQSDIRIKRLEAGHDLVVEQRDRSQNAHAECDRLRIQTEKERDDLKAEVDRLQCARVSNEATIESLKAELEAVRRVAKRIEDACQNLESQNQTLVELSNKDRDEIRDLNAKLAIEQQSRERNWKERCEFEEKYSASQVTIELQKSQLEGASNESAMWKRRYENAERQANRMNEELDKLKSKTSPGANADQVKAALLNWSEHWGVSDAAAVCIAAALSPKWLDISTLPKTSEFVWLTDGFNVMRRRSADGAFTPMWTKWMPEFIPQPPVKVDVDSPCVRELRPVLQSGNYSDKDIIEIVKKWEGKK